MKMFTLGLTLLAACTCLAAQAQPRGGAATARGIAPATFADYDRDGNGTISEAEFNAVRAERRAANQVGQASRRAAMSLTFQQMDRDGDGQITREEFDAAHATRPAPRRGAMGPGANRAPRAGMGAGMGAGAPGAGMDRPAFADFDLNGDGVITEPEFHAARSGRISGRLQEGRPMRNLENAGSFADMDANKDGKVSRSEFDAYQASRARAPAR